MNDKNFTRFLFIMLFLFVLWWLLLRRRHGQSSPQNLPVAIGGTNTTDPQILTYEANPGAFGPSTINGTITANVSGYNGLNQNYMPLFGFVGMAQGELYQ